MCLRDFVFLMCQLILLQVSKTNLFFSPQEQVSLINICKFYFDSVYIHCVSFFDILILCF